MSINTHEQYSCVGTAYLTLQALKKLNIYARAFEVLEIIEGAPDSGHVFVVPDEFEDSDKPLNQFRFNDSITCGEVRQRGIDLTQKILNEWTLDMM